MESHFNGSGFPGVSGPVPQTAVLDFLFPGFSTISGFVLRYLGIDLNVYIPLLVLAAGVAYAWDYVRGYTWSMISEHFMSTAEVGLFHLLRYGAGTWLTDRLDSRG